MKQDAVISEAYRTGRHFQLFKEKLQDPFQEIGKLAEPAVCSNCGAVYREGRWQWASAPLDAYLTRCPACKRVHQKMPAGYVSIQGEFAHDHRDEILNLIHHLETREKAEHPLKRIMWIEYQEEGLLVTCTDIHLARGIGDALHKAYRGELDYHYCEDEYLLRVRWKR